MYGGTAYAGADLDPLQVLSALSSEMPLSAGVDILSHLLCERLHRHRQGGIVRSLHKACSLSASVDRAEVLPVFPLVAQSMIVTVTMFIFFRLWVLHEIVSLG